MNDYIDWARNHSDKKTSIDDETFDQLVSQTQNLKLESFIILFFKRVLDNNKINDFITISEKDFHEIVSNVDSKGNSKILNDISTCTNENGDSYKND